MDSASDAEYRLRLASGFLAEAEDDLRSSRWRSCVDNAQLAVENAAKSAIARFGPVPRRHDTSTVLNEHLRQGSVPPELRDGVERLLASSGIRGFSTGASANDRSKRERARWRLIGRGVGIHWPSLDEDISVEGLLAGRRSGESQESLKRWFEARMSARPDKRIQPTARRARRG
jgi:hypothetical protein